MNLRGAVGKPQHHHETNGLSDAAKSILFAFAFEYQSGGSLWPRTVVERGIRGERRKERKGKERSRFSRNNGNHNRNNKSCS